MSLKQKRNAWQGDIESLSIHGLSRVASVRNKYGRMIWLLLCITAAISFGIVAVKSFVKYYQFQTFSHVTVKQRDKLALPAITFCHKNADFPKSFNSNDRPVVQHLPVNCSLNDRKHFTNIINQKVFEIACRIFVGTFKSKASAMPNKYATPRYFQFPENFELTPYKHPCVTLNRNLTLVQQAEGEKYGLHMIMYNEGHNISGRFSSDEPLCDNRNGVYAVIHDSKEVVPMGVEIAIPPGYHTHISIKKNVVMRLPHPYPSNCTNDWSNHESIYPGKNTQKMCTNSCAYKQLYKMCPGVLPELRMFMQTSEYPAEGDGKNPRFLKCLSRSIPNVNYQQCDCPEHCYDETYTTVIYRSPWPPQKTVPWLLRLIDNIEGKANKTLSVNGIRERFMKLSVSYNEFKENVSEELPLYDLIAILSDLGGQMGLFMGASLLSIAEIIDIVGKAFKRLLCNCDNSIAIAP